MKLLVGGDQKKSNRLEEGDKVEGNYRGRGKIANRRASTTPGNDENKNSKFNIKL